MSPSFVVLPVVVDSSGSLPEEVRLQGPAGTSFSASPSAPWLQVTPTSGQIPPGGVAVLEVRAASCASPAPLPNQTAAVLAVDVGGTSLSVQVLRHCLHRYRAVGAGYFHTLAVREDGHLFAWGQNNGGQLGDGTYQSRATPVQVQGIAGVREATGGLDFTVILKEDGTVWSVGANNYGQLGDGTLVSRTQPVQVQTATGPLTNVVAVAAGGHHALALTQTGAVYAWGRGGKGQLGQGQYQKSTVAVRVHDPGDPTGWLTGVTAIATGYESSYALKGGAVYSWGDNGHGQVDPTDPGLTKRNLPDLLPNLPTVRKISVKWNTGFAQDANGTWWAWGCGVWNQIPGPFYSDYSGPAALALNNFASPLVAAAGFGTLFLDQGGQRTVWFRAHDQNLVAYQSYPFAASFRDAEGGFTHAVFLDEEGRVWTVGENGDGQLGDGTHVDRNHIVFVAAP
ncbi:hypothetical protein TthAK1_22190 (plasmid) [Thermus thermophilus]|nr:hypothetical protein TthAK1_22190 [Thermus thermophilus]